MEEKMFETRGGFGLAKKGLNGMSRLIHGLVTRGFEVSADSCGDQKQLNTFNVLAYRLAKQRMHEIEKTKAVHIVESRHQSWKAGGPL